MSYTKHWSSENNNSNKIQKLEENKTYKIKDVVTLQTSFGKKFVLVDEDDKQYWTNNQVNEFLKENRKVKQFELITSEFKIFVNKKGDEIRYLSIDINY